MNEFDPEIPELEAMGLLEFGGEQDLVTAAVAHAQTALPEWQPRESNTELVLIESLAMILGVEALAIQMLPAQIVEQLMGLYGVTRSEGLFTRGKVLFRVTNSALVQSIPVGTRLRYELEVTDETIDFLTAETLTIQTGEALSGQVAVIADEIGIEGNGIPAGLELELVSQLPFVESVTFTEATTGGAGEESDQSFNARAAAVLARTTNTLVVPENFSDACLSRPEVGRALTLDLHNPADVPASPVVGHVTVVVASHEGEPLDSETMAELQLFLSGQALASLTIHVVKPTYTPVDIAVTVSARTGFTADEVKTAVEESIRAWVTPRTWDWSPTVDQYALIGVVHEVPGVSRVSFASPTIPLAGDAPLPRLTTVTVTVS